MSILAGTSGYSYGEWKGTFYPKDIDAGELLAFYATKLPTVEINNTFYRMPRVGVLETWAQNVPEDFRFAIKASRRITHLKRLANTEEETAYILDTARTMGDRLGAVLFQLPPNLKKDLPLLESFLELLREDMRVAFEFRHPSWDDDEVHDRLRSRNCALVIADVDDADPPDLVRTADWGYLRLRRAEYDAASLDAWIERLRAQDWSDAFVFFKHEDAAAGPRLADTFTEMARR
ncbi:MAG: DUF72 domain-containing protein [Planctomycetes bacterium]|nr:DUF72 domain-containing protein [Planctomycetota bacterium]